MKRPHQASASGLTWISLALLAAAALLASCQFASIPATPSNRYALVIGVQDYPGDNHDLNYPDDDASELATLLVNQGWNVKQRLIATSDLSIATDGSPTYANIQSDIATLSTDPNATILVYYSGHGSLVGNTTYIIPYNGLYLNGNSYTIEGITYYESSSDLTKWITPATMTTWMAAVPARHRILILDSCYSGGFVTSDAAVDTSPANYSQRNGTTMDTGVIAAALSRFNTLVAANLSGFGNQEIQVLSAAGSDEYSYDDSGHKNGAFTYYLLQAGETDPSTTRPKGDVDGDGAVTVDEAYVYAKKQLLLHWNTINALANNDFLPHISGGTGDVVLYAGN